MDATNQEKILNAGFTIIRKEEGRQRRNEGPAFIANNLMGGKIKYKNNEQREWKTLEKDFVSNAALDRRMKELLKDEKTVED